MLEDNESHDSLFFERFRLLSKLGEGSFGKIYKGIDTVSNRLVAIKVENSSRTSQLKLEAHIYKEFEGTPINKTTRWPKMQCFGSDSSGNNVMIMDLLGPNLEVLLKKTTHGKLSETAVAFIAEKMITLVELFHFGGFVHRDLKPQNFVIEYCEKTYPMYPEVYLIDYGLAKSFIQPDKTHAPFAQKKSLKGTVRYSSVNTHLGMEQSRRDDLQSLGYIFLYMLLGKLPWQNLVKDRDKKEAYHHIMILKMRIPAQDLVANIESPIMREKVLSYLLYVESLMYREQPNYSYCRELFRNVAGNFTGNIFKGSINRPTNSISQ